MAFQYLANLLLKARPVGYDKHLDKPTGGPRGTHPPGNLNRNRAALLLHMLESDTVVGDDWLGISGDSNFHFAGAQNLKILKSDVNGTMDVSGIFGHPDPLIVGHRFHPKKESDFNGMCSEVALINGLSHYLAAYPLEGEPAELFLITERIPCKSCTALLKKFLKHYTGIQLHLAFMFEPTERTGEETIERGIHDVRKKLGGQIKTYMVELVSSNDQGSKNICDGIQRRPRWRPEGVGSLNCMHNANSATTTYSLSIVPVLPGPRAILDHEREPLERGAGEHSDHISARVAPSLSKTVGINSSKRRFSPANSNK